MDENILKYISGFITLDNENLKLIETEEKQRDDTQPSIELEIGKLLGLLARLMDAKNVLELGTCLGYSTIWLGEAVKSTNGKVLSIERGSKLYQDAKKNIERAKLENYVELLLGDVSQVIYDLQGPYDIIFQDSQKSLYPKLLDKTIELTKPGGLIIADDTLFKIKGAPRNLGASMDEYNKLVFDDNRLYSTILPVGDGVTISYKLKS
ncbi:O-methyltransferase [Natranaerobius trueperi]|uniref:Methyltransferase n=1 Tax=Natranaerobius trueperi TaxID=759412 RepID=A0A226C058_9FIRM|nr:O-methyltransferase [Natranaerobius trueperi]OWZ84432.1 methyltransferase [Natranaerobius trueperi]